MAYTMRIAERNLWKLLRVDIQSSLVDIYVNRSNPDISVEQRRIHLWPTTSISTVPSQFCGGHNLVSGKASQSHQIPICHRAVVH